MITKHCPVTALSPVAAADPDGHYFFGYYDKCPWNAESTRVLAHRATFVDRMPRPGDPLELGTLAADGSGDWQPFATTQAWNWQQGAQLQWLPKRENESGQRIVYNDLRDGQLVTVIRKPDDSEQTHQPAIYTIDAAGRYALCLSYGRLTGQRPEYGYPAVADTNAGDPLPDSETITRLDLDTGETKTLIDLPAVVNHQPHPLGEGAFHYFNHLYFTPSGKRFCFMHRFERSDGITHTRLFSLSIDGTDLRLMMEGMVSHYDWRDDNTLLAWAGARKLLGGGNAKKKGPVGTAMGLARKTLKPIYYALGKPRFLMNRIVGDSYLLLPDAEPSPSQPWAKGQLTCDGHCTFSPNGKWVVTDGYPDRQNRQPLYLATADGQTVYEIGRYATPKHLDGPTRVDLHPRFSADGHRILLDSAMDGRRRMYVVDVSAIVNASPASETTL